jgi:DNA-binding protein WhiA
VRRLLMLLGTARAAPQALRTPGARTVGLSWQGIPTDARTASRRHPRAYCRALVRGVTLAAGYLYDPEHGYHLEWTVPHAEADRLARCLGHLGVRARRGAGRRRGVRLYAEEGEAISSLLTEMGAAESLLAWGNVRALRQVRGRVNREVNAETANLKRSVAAGLRQADRLATLSRHDLPPPLRAVLEARLANPTASLGELAELLGLGRSAVHHRLRGLERRAQGQAPPRRERDR